MKNTKFFLLALVCIGISVQANAQQKHEQVVHVEIEIPEIKAMKSKIMDLEARLIQLQSSSRAEFRQSEIVAEELFELKQAYIVLLNNEIEQAENNDLRNSLQEEMAIIQQQQTTTNSKN